MKNDKRIVLNMTEYCVENIMLNVFEDNDVKRKTMKESFDNFINKYKEEK